MDFVVGGFCGGWLVARAIGAGDEDGQGEPVRCFITCINKIMQLGKKCGFAGACRHKLVKVFTSEWSVGVPTGYPVGGGPSICMQT